MADRYPPPRRSDRPQMYEFGRGSQSHGDSYRPGNFSFQMPSNQGRPTPRFHQQEQSLPAHRHSNRRPNGTKYPPRNDRGNRGSRGGRRFFERPGTSDRPLLKRDRAPTPEQMQGMNEGESRFRSVNDISDSEEEDMQLDSDIGEGDGSDIDIERQPPHKKARIEPSTQAPKWSNPDPYTALPPPDESLGKRKDVVKMIRKAKAGASETQVARADGDDFISFDFGDGKVAKPESEPESEGSSIVELTHFTSAPTGSRFSHLDNLHPHRVSTIERSTAKYKDAEMRLHIGNFPYSANENDLRKAFAGYTM